MSVSGVERGAVLRVGSLRNSARVPLRVSRPGALRPGGPRAGGGLARGAPGRCGTDGENPAPWHYAKHVSAALADAADTRTTRRHVRYAQRGVLWTESTIERVRKCGRVPGASGDVLVRNHEGVAHYTGLTTCGSIWACPVCSAKIRNRRADDISTATARWVAAGNEVYMATFTAPHDLGMRLKPLLGAIADGFRHVVAGRAWIALKKRLGIVGQIRSMEITHGRSGWHPHLHVLVFVEGRLDAMGLAQLGIHIRERWTEFITRAGYRTPHEDHGVDLQRCESAEDAGRYVAKTQDGRSVGNELARADLKTARAKNRTPLEVLDDFRWTGDADDLRVWHEYERATKGRQCITWSKGLRALLLDDDQEQTDEEVAAEEVGGDDVALIPGETWRAITRVPGLPAALLDACERGGLDAMNGLLGRYCVGTVGPPPELVGARAEGPA
jgi:hypothetical protein